MPPVTVVTPEVISAIERNAIIQVRCSSSSNSLTNPDRVNITWSRDGGNLPASAVISADGTLTLNASTRLNSGVYRCTTINPAGQSSAIASIAVVGMLTS